MLILLYQDKRRLQNIYLSSSFLCMFYPMASVSVSLPSSCQCIPDTRLLMMNKIALCCACDRHTAPTSERTRPRTRSCTVSLPRAKSPTNPNPPPPSSPPRNPITPHSANTKDAPGNYSPSFSVGREEARPATRRRRPAVPHNHEIVSE